MAELVLACDIAAPREKVWAALVDWSQHDKWMFLTRATGGAGVGEPIEAFTGIGRIGFLDTMTITVWEPPQRAVVRHTGRIVRGSGAFEVRETAPGCSRVVWSEWVDLPLGVIGRLGWPLVRPWLKAGVSFSLRRLADHVETKPA
jgi:carbon monoxide dehydrogenase subunit G